MDPKLRQFLVSLGLNPNATDAQARKFLSSLSKKQRAEAARIALAAATAADGDEGDGDDGGDPEALALESGQAAALGGGGEPVVVNVNLGNGGGGGGEGGGEPADKKNKKPAAGAAGDVVALEKKRIDDIKALAALYPGLDQTVANGQISLETATVGDAKKVFLAAMAKQNPAVAGAVRVGEDQARVSLAAAIPDAIRLRTGMVTIEKPHERAQQLRGLRVLDMFRHWLAAHGAQDAFLLSPTQLIDRLGPTGLRRAYPNIALSQSTGDFSSILADTINKSLRQAYLDAPTTWQEWARRVTNPDFKQITRAALSESADLIQRDEGGEIKYVSLTDSKETYTLLEYTRGIRLTRRALINDDLDAFGRVPMLQGSAARRKEDDVAYAIITANANLADTGALFNSTAVTTVGGHANLAAVSAAITVASLSATKTLIRKQKGPKNAARLEATPRFLLVPTSIEDTAKQVIASTVDPSKNTIVPNPFANAFKVIGSTRLDDNSVTAWYLLADYRDGQVDTIEVCFLEGETEPVLKQETDFDTDDQKFAVRHTVAAKAIDFRGMAKNAGA